MNTHAGRQYCCFLIKFLSNPLRYFLPVALLTAALFLSAGHQSFAQSDMAEIEFWQSVKTSQDPAELKAYLDIYPQGKFAPLARLRIKKLTPKPEVSPQPAPQPVAQPAKPALREIPRLPSSTTTPTAPPPPPQPPAPPPPLNLPVFKPDSANETNASCQIKLGPQGIAQADFSGTGTICLCRPPYEISPDGAACIASARVEPPPRKPDTAISRPQPRPRSRPERVRKKPRPVRVQRNSVKRPSKARARAIANRYCRRRYGKNLKSVVVKKSKFYCHYQLEDGNYLAVKKKKFKDVPQ